jgi:hypothetical protein
MEQKPRITIEVSGGMVQNVYTTLETDVEVDILDFDGDGYRPDDDRADREAYLRQVIAEQRQIY